MAGTSTIEWTDATWNVATGCDRVSPGCDHCYALTMAARLKLMGSAHYQTDGDPKLSGPGFGFAFHPDVLAEPLRWRKPRRIFVNSMSDLFHPDALNAMRTDQHGVEWPFLAEVFAVMVQAHWHTFQILTKRPQLMAGVLNHPRFRLDVNAILLREGHAVMPGGMTDPDFRWPRHIWCGTSIENNRYAFRADHLRSTSSAVRFLSLEPLLSELPDLDLAEIDWVIVGGESGQAARPMHPEWARDIRDRCLERRIPFTFKQWGAWAPVQYASLKKANQGRQRCFRPDGHEQWVPSVGSYAVMERMGKHEAGRILDGRVWDEQP